MALIEFGRWFGSISMLLRDVQSDMLKHVDVSVPKQDVGEKP